MLSCCRTGDGSSCCGSGSKFGYFVPAILGAAAVLILAIDLVKTCSRVSGSGTDGA